MGQILKELLLSYGGFSILGLGAVFGALCLLCRKKGYRLWEVAPYLTFGLLPLYLGAKLFGILSLMAYRVNIGRAIDWSVIGNAGIVFYGGLLGFLLYCGLLLPKLLPRGYKRVQPLGTLSIPLFHGFARIGCYFGRCCYGLVCHNGLWEGFFEHRLPVQLLESGFNFLLFALLLGLYLKGKRRQLTDIYLLCYSVFRFCIEFFRGDEIRGFIGLLSFSQWVSIGIWLYLLVRYICWDKNRKGEGRL